MKQLHKTNILGTQYSWQALQNGMRDGVPMDWAILPYLFPWGLPPKTQDSLHSRAFWQAFCAMLRQENMLDSP